MDLVNAWPQLEELKRAGPHVGRWGQALSLVVASALAQFVRRHARCLGLRGGCPVCLEYMPAARLNREYWISLCGQLAVHLADDKHQDLGQSLEYGGFVIETHQGSLTTAPDKLNKILAGLLEWKGMVNTTIRVLAEHRGRLIHYSLGISHVRVLATELSWYIGSDSEPDYDREIAMSPQLQALADEIIGVISVFGALGRPLWPPVPSSLVGAFERGEAKDHLAILSTDSSPAGWAALLRWWDDQLIQEQLFVGTWPPGSVVGEQVHRESLGVTLGYQAALCFKNLRGWAVIQRNDALPVIAALRKGSSQSRVLQEMALQVNRINAANHVELIPMHVPGTTLVDEGIDGASRDGDDFGRGANVGAIQGPAVSDALWIVIQEVAAKANLRMSIDRFATASNSRLERFNSRFPEPNAEATDALAQVDWDTSLCPGCGLYHREVNYLFSPRPMERAALKKAISDGALAVIVLPLAVTNPFWHKLVRTSLVQNQDGYVRVKGAKAQLLQSVGHESRELAVFACDFGLSTVKQTQTAVPPCAGFYKRRPKAYAGPGPEDSTLRRLRSELQRLPGWRG